MGRLGYRPRDHWPWLGSSAEPKRGSPLGERRGSADGKRPSSRHSPAASTSEGLFAVPIVWQHSCPTGPGTGGTRWTKKCSEPTRRPGNQRSFQCLSSAREQPDRSRDYDVWQGGSVAIAPTNPDRKSVV